MAEKPTLGRGDSPQPPRKILFVITDLDAGGAEKCCVQLAAGLDRRRWAPAVCSLDVPGRMAEPLEAAGIAVHSLHAPSVRRAPLALWQLTRLIARFRPAIVQTFLLHANVLGRIAAALRQVPAVVSSIRVAERRHRFHWVLETLTHRLAHKTVCVSDSVKRFTQVHSHIAGDRLVVIPNGIATSGDSEAQSAARERWGMPPGIWAMYAGRLDEQKGVDVLLRAMAIARQRVPALRLGVAGAGPERQALERLTRALGLEESVRYFGWCGDVPGLLAAADYFVLPSRWEGMPNVVLEAMAARLAVVATRTEGTTELVHAGECGRLVRVDDAGSLAEAMVELATDGLLRERLGRNGRQHVERHYSLSTMVSRYERLYERLLSSRGRDDP